ncbi:MAG: AMP-binding protein [Ilumatobacteraceae bacterium]
MHTAMILEMVAEAAGDRVAVGPRHGGRTYADLLAGARGTAALLRRHGATNAAMVGLNSDAVPLMLFGASFAGVPFAPVNYRLGDEQLRAILQRLSPALAVVDDDVVPRIGTIEGIELMSTTDFLAEIAAPGVDDGARIDATGDADDIAILLFTSGTTGEPKAAVLRHRHLTSYILSTVEFIGADEDEAQLVTVPAYHIAGISAVLSSVFAGRRICYLPAFDAVAWVRTADDEAITQAMVVPTMLGRVLDEIEREGRDLKALRNLSYGGGRMPVPVIERAMRMLPDVSWVNAYGLTETSSTIAVLGPDDHRAAFASGDPDVRARLGSVGRPLPSIELEVRDLDGAAVPVGERGEIYVRGDQIAGEYLGRSVLTEDGWFPTNDAGHLDDDGYLFLEGRLDDVIVRGAENLSPGEIEDVLVTHPAVAEAAVFGLPDTEWGEKVVAAVVLQPGVDAQEAALQDWVRDRLRSTKTPARIHFCAELPHNETGKLLRRVLKAELADAD